MYIVIEIQTKGDSVSTLTYKYDSLNLAEQKYYTILASASVSSLDIHSAVIIDPRGITIKNDFYDNRGVKL